MNQFNVLKKFTLIRVVPAFNSYQGGSKNDIKELTKRSNSYFKKQIVIAPFDPNNPQNYDDQFEFKIIRVQCSYIEKKIPIINWFISNSIYYFKVLRVLKKIEQIDLIQAHEINPIIWSCIIGKIINVPVIGMLHGTAEAYSEWAGFCETILAFFFRPTHSFIVDSGTRAPEKFRKIWGKRVTVVNHGIDQDIYHPMGKNIGYLRKFNIRESDIIILSISALIPVKNINMAIELLEKLPEIVNNSRIFLLICGDGEQKIELEKMVNAKGLNHRVRFLGQIKNELIPDLISIADICIGMSLKDNLNRSILEPMACGKPIVAFSGGIIDDFILSGFNGFLAKKGDLSDFTEKIEILINSPKIRLDMGKHAYELIKRERSLDQRIMQDIMVITDIMNSY